MHVSTHLAYFAIFSVFLDFFFLKICCYLVKIFLYVIVVIYFSSFDLTITRKCLTKMPIVSLTDIWQLSIASYGQQHFTVLGSLLLLSIKYLYKKIIDFINAFSKGVTFTTYWRAWVSELLYFAEIQCTSGTDHILIFASDKESTLFWALWFF